MLSNFLVNADQAIIDLPEGLEFSEAEFSRRGVDLVLKGDAVTGLSIYVRRFFEVAEYPILKTANGEVLPGAIAAQLATLSQRAVAALMTARRA